MKKAYEDYLQLKPYQFVSWLSQQFDIDTPYTFTTEDDINRGLEVLSVYAQNISFWKICSLSASCTAEN